MPSERDMDLNRVGGFREEARRPGRADRLASGTLSCERCDAPVLPPGPVSPADRLSCPFCGHSASVRDFLSLAEPLRPTRVEVRVRPPSR